MQIKVVSRSTRPPGLLRMPPEQRDLVLEELEQYLKTPQAYPLSRSLGRAIDDGANELLRLEDPGMTTVMLRRLLTFAVLQPIVGEKGELVRVPVMEILYAKPTPRSPMVSDNSPINVTAFQVVPARLGAEYLIASFPTSDFEVLGVAPLTREFDLAHLAEIPPQLRIHRFSTVISPQKLPLSSSTQIQEWLTQLDYIARLLPRRRTWTPLAKLALSDESPVAQWAGISADEDLPEGDIVEESSRMAREVEEHARQHLLEHERAIWAQLAQERGARQWGYEIAKRLGLPLKGLRPGDPLTALPPKVLKMIRTRMEMETRQAQAVANNKCPHLKLIPQFRRAQTLADADKTFTRLVKLFAKGANTGPSAREFITCTLCSFDLLCPHVVQLHLAQMEGLKRPVSSADLQRRMRPFVEVSPLPRDVVDERPEMSLSQLRHSCRICVEPISAIEETGLARSLPAEEDSLRMQELSTSLAEDLGFQDEVLKSLRSQQAIAKLVLRSPDIPVESIVGPSERAARPFVAAIDDAIGKKRLLHRETRLRVFAAIYLWAGILAMGRKRTLGINDQKVSPDSVAAFLRRLLRRALDEIAPADTGFLRRTLDAATQRVLLAVQALEKRGIRLASTGPSEAMYRDWLLANGVYQWLNTMSGQQVKKQTPMDRMKSLLGAGVEKVLKHGATTPFVDAKIPQTPSSAKKALDAVAESPPTMEWIAPDGSPQSVDIDNEAWAGLVWESFQQTMTLTMAPNRSVYHALQPEIDVLIAREQTLVRNQRAWYRYPVGSLCSFGEPDAAGGLGATNGEFVCPHVARTEPILARLYNDDGTERVWDRFEYSNGRDKITLTLKEMAAAYADPDQHKEILRKYVEPGLIIVEKWSGDLRWSTVNNMSGESLRKSNDKIRRAREHLASVDDTLRAFATLCPAGTPEIPGHIFKDQRCTRCGFAFNLTLKERDAYHTKWAKAFDETVASLSQSEFTETVGVTEVRSSSPPVEEKLPPSVEKLLRQIRDQATSPATLAKMALRFKLPAWSVTYMGATTNVPCEEISQGKAEPPVFGLQRLIGIYGRIDTVSRDVTRLSHGIIPSSGEFDPYKNYRDLVGEIPLKEMRALAKTLHLIRETARLALREITATMDDLQYAVLGFLNLLGEVLELTWESGKLGQRLSRWYLEMFTQTDKLFCKIPPGGFKLTTRAARELAGDLARSDEVPIAMDADGQPSHEIAQQERMRESGAENQFSLEHQDFDGFDDDYEVD